MSTETAISTGQFCIIQGEKKTQLVRISSLGNKFVGVVQEERGGGETKRVEFGVDDIVLNLGKNPPAGSILGHKTHYLYRGKSLSLGRVADTAFLMYRPEDSEALAEVANTTGNRVYKKLKSEGLQGLCSDVRFELTDKVGKYAGMYFPEKKDYPPQIRVTLEEAAMETASVNSKEYLLYHELAHHLDFSVVSKNDKARAAWLNGFRKSISPIYVSEEEMESLYSTLQSGLEDTSIKSIKEMSGVLTEDTAPMFKAIIRWIAKNHRVSPLDINALLRAGDSGAIEYLWPKKPVTVERLTPEVSEYSCKNAREFFAEAFAFYMCEMKLPSYITRLVENSIKYGSRQLAI